MRRWKLESFSLAPCRKDQTKNMCTLLLWNQRPSLPYQVALEEGGSWLEGLVLRVCFVPFWKLLCGLKHLSEAGEHYRCSWSISSLVSSSGNLFVPLRTADRSEPKHWMIRFVLRKCCSHKRTQLHRTHPETDMYGIWFQSNSVFKLLLANRWISELDFLPEGSRLLARTFSQPI